MTTNEMYFVTLRVKKLIDKGYPQYDGIAPKLVDVLKWLRVEKKIEVTACITKRKWYYVIQLLDKEKQPRLNKYQYDSPEEALRAGIEYVVDNIL